MRDELLNIRNCRKTPVACKNVFWCLQIAKMFDMMCVITRPIPSVVVKVGDVAINSKHTQEVCPP